MLKNLALQEKTKSSLKVEKRTLIMGVLNTTPDSFSDGGLFLNEDDAVKHALKMVKEGADIIDIGGESTRPGAKGVALDEELARTIPVIKKLAEKTNVLISIDTAKSDVARKALEAGASIVNDITGLKGDSHMAEVAAEFNATVVLMHIKGTPRTMQQNPVYKDLINEIIKSLKESIEIAETAGIDKDKIIIDPGIGFGKTTEHNLEIIDQLARFKALKKPILIGVSRKSFIGSVLDVEPDKRIMGTASSCALAIANGADIIRVHDVSEMKQVTRMTDAITRRGR